MNIYLIMENMRMLPRKILWFIQRGRRGYSSGDLWNFDYSLIEMLVEVLEFYRDKEGTDGNSCFYDGPEGQDRVNKIINAFRDYLEIDYTNDADIIDIVGDIIDIAGDIPNADFRTTERSREEFMEAWNTLGRHLGDLWT